MPDFTFALNTTDDIVASTEAARPSPAMDLTQSEMAAQMCGWRNHLRDNGTSLIRHIDGHFYLYLDTSSAGDPFVAPGLIVFLSSLSEKDKVHIRVQAGGGDYSMATPNQYLAQDLPLLYALSTCKARVIGHLDRDFTHADFLYMVACNELVPSPLSSLGLVPPKFDDVKWYDQTTRPFIHDFMYPRAVERHALLTTDEVAKLINGEYVAVMGRELMTRLANV